MTGGSIRTMPRPTFLSEQARCHAGALACLAIVSGALFFYRFDERGLWSAHEGRAGQHAQVMLDTGEWGMPSLYGVRADYQKPPLYYWLVAGAAWLRGEAVDGWAVRLPAALAGVLGVWAVYWTGSMLWRPPVGFAAALVTATSLRYTWLARVGRIDMPLTLATTICLGCFARAWRELRNRTDHAAAARPWLAAMYVAVAVAVMLKGPVGLVLPGLAILLFIFFDGSGVWPHRRAFWQLLGRLGVAWGVPLAAAIALPWYVWAAWSSDGEFLRSFFLHHNLQRSLGAEGMKPEPVWYYLPQLFIDLFPWSVLLPCAVVGAWRHRRADLGARLGLAWIVAMFAFLSLVRFKRHDYLLPLVPGFGLLIGAYWGRLSQEVADWRWGRLLGWGNAMAAATLALAMAGLSHPRFGPDLVRLLGHALDLNAYDRLVLDSIRHLSDRHGHIVIVLAGLLGLGSVALIGAVHSRRPGLTVGLVAAGWLVACLLYVQYTLPALEPLRDQRPIAQLARRASGHGSRLYYYGWEDQQMMFCLGRPVYWIRNRQRLLKLFRRADPVFVVMDIERYEARRADWPAVRMHVLARNTDNAWGAHRNPAVLVANDAGAAATARRHLQLPRAN
jgi:4-amino-4-deoxy-L-arabinose transferase-like glycosyltransferase